jgi:hypothetical protein
MGKSMHCWELSSCTGLEFSNSALCVLCLIPVIAPVASASIDPVMPGSQNIIIQDNAELLSALKTHAAYIGKTQEVRVGGVIHNIERISGGMVVHVFTRFRRTI